MQATPGRSGAGHDLALERNVLILQRARHLPLELREVFAKALIRLKSVGIGQ
jgi:hypothetical protein